MKKSIPWRFLAVCWLLCLIYIFALQYSAPDIPYFIHYENMYLLAFVCSISLTLQFYFSKKTIQNSLPTKGISYSFLILAYPVFFVIAKILWPHAYQPNATLLSLGFNYLLFLGAALCFALGGEFFFFLLTKWNQWVRRSMTLKLTQTLILIVLIFPMLLVAGSIFINAWMQRGETTFAFTPPVTYLGKFFTSVAIQLFPLTGFTIGIGVIAGLAAFPFVFILSWGIAKHYTRRLRHLVESVRQMKTGDLRTRVLIDGEDEIGRLSTDFNEMAETLEASQKELIQKQEKISALLASQKEWLLKISHELRTPITTLKAILESTPPEPWEENDRRILILQQEVDSLHRLIEDLFTLSQNEHAQLSFQMQSFQIPKDLTALLSPLQQYAWEQKRIEIAIQLDLPPLVILVDHMRFSQVLHNLIHNAVRYTPRGGLISIRASRMEDQFLLTIEDTGEGIPRELIQKVWDPFHKHPRSTGAGIGLPLSKELITSMGGSIEIKSEPDCGACFEIKIPIP